MTILHLSSALTWRGGEQQVYYLINELNKTGIIQYIAMPLDSELHKKLESEQPHHSLWAYKKESGLNIRFALKIKSFCKKHKIDIIHAHDSHAHTAAFIAALLGNKTKVIISRRVDFHVGQSFLSRWKYNHKSIFKIICVSDAIKDIMSKVIKHKEKLITIYSGIDTLRFPFKNKTGKLRNILMCSEDTFLVGNTSALADHKDYFTFVDTAQLVLAQLPQVRFAIIGDGPIFNQIKAYIESKNLSQYINLLGFKSNIPELLPDLDVFFMPSKTEGLGTSLLDAMACNVPIVTTHAGGIPELIKHEYNGMLGNVGDAHRLAALIIELYKNHALASQLAINAQNTLLNFTKEQTAMKTMEVYGVVSDE